MATKKTRRASALPPVSDEQLALAERTQNAHDQAERERIEDEQEQQRLADSGEPEARDALRAVSSIQYSQPLDPPPPKRAKKIVTKSAPVDHEPVLHDEPPPEIEGRAYQLMDMAFRKWKKTSQKDIRRANRELAQDLGGDGAIYLKAGILRLGDLLDSMTKLTAVGKQTEHDPDGEDYEEEMAELRKDLRGGD